jgi:hypothetical protein
VTITLIQQSVQTTPLFTKTQTQTHPITAKMKATTTTPTPLPPPSTFPTLRLSVASATTEERLATALDKEANTSDEARPLVVLEEGVYLGAAVPVVIAMALLAVRVKEEEEMVGIRGRRPMVVLTRIAARVLDKCVVCGEVDMVLCFIR